MTNIIVAFSKPEDGKNIKSILVRNGFQVVAGITFAVLCFKDGVAFSFKCGAESLFTHDAGISCRIYIDYTDGTGGYACRFKSF